MALIEPSAEIRRGLEQGGVLTYQRTRVAAAGKLVVRPAHQGALAIELVADAGKDEKQLFAELLEACVREAFDRSRSAQEICQDTALSRLAAATFPSALQGEVSVDAAVARGG